MEEIGVLMTSPMSPYLEQELDRRFKPFRLWNAPQRTEFLKSNSGSIRAIVGNRVGADAALIDSLPGLEIVASCSVGVDMIDLGKCREKGIRVTNTPDVPTENVADLAIGLMLATLRRICECNRYVRSGLWKKGDFKLTTKFSGKPVGIIGMGRIGSAIAKRAEAFGCPISYYSRSVKLDSKYKYYPNVVDLASNCHVLVVACALTLCLADPFQFLFCQIPCLAQTKTRIQFISILTKSCFGCFTNPSKRGRICQELICNSTNKYFLPEIPL